MQRLANVVLGAQWALICLAVLCLALAEARWHNLKGASRRHGLQESVVEDLTELLKETRESEELAFDRHRRRRYPDSQEIGDESTDEEEEEELAYDELESPRRRLVGRRKHRARPHLRHRHRAGFDPAKLADNDESTWERRRGKRYNVKPMTGDVYKEYIESKLHSNHEDPHAFELEVHEAQNSSLCNFTVIPIADPGGRIPSELEHVKCNHAGHRCQEKGTYCCIQTFRYQEVVYLGGKKDKIKVYSGCVCSLRIYGTLEPYLPKLDLDN